MPAYSFQTRFAEPILAGTKGGTIRATRKGIHRREVGGHARPGDPLMLYTGMRTRQCRKIADKTCCAVERIHLSFNNAAVHFPDRGIVLDTWDQIDAFASFDGFESWVALDTFWAIAHSESKAFDGWHIRWLPLPEGLGLMDWTVWTKEYGEPVPRDDMRVGEEVYFRYSGEAQLGRIVGEGTELRVPLRKLLRSGMASGKPTIYWRNRTQIYRRKNV